MATLLMLGVFAAPKAEAFRQYSVNGTSGNCVTCHGGFRTSPYISNVDGTSWGASLHDVHRLDMLDFDCNTCHSAGGRSPVILDSSDGGIGLAPIACVGCHGREEDIGNDDTSFGRGAGLRQHHTKAGILNCTDCHLDAIPAFYTPVGEDVLPPYYFTPDLDHPNKPTDSCNPAGEEDYAGNLDGLDNDGDDQWDTADDDCRQVVCGDSIVGPGEQCDDGNTLDGDCCSSTCTFDPAGSSCTDGQFCNGEETCDSEGSCEAGPQADCSDGVECTDDVCDAATDACVNAANDANCSDDGLFCDGSEFCDAILDCSATGNPCAPGEVCIEPDTCQVAEQCGNGVVEGGEECDGTECCAADCTFEPQGTSCEDGVFCNGAESCGVAGTCAAVSACPPFIDGCVTRNASCDEVNNACVDEADDAACDDSMFCNGVETCDLASGSCDLGTSVDCNDGVECTDDVCDAATDACVNAANDAICPDDALFCTGTAVCDPNAGCVSTGNPCAPGEVCIEPDICEAAPGCGNGVVDPGEDCDGTECCSANCTFEPQGTSCEDGVFCNGAESCDGGGSCEAGARCDDGVDCTIDACDEVNNQCQSTANDNLCADDGSFCTGVEVCDVFAGCVSTGDPCAGGTTCNEDTNTCEGDGGKVVICHIPRGNPDRAHTIRVGFSAVPAHLAHGDFLGPCDDDDDSDRNRDRDRDDD